MCVVVHQLRLFQIEHLPSQKMKKLELSFQLLSQVSKTLSRSRRLQSPLSKSLVGSLAQTNPKHLPNTQSHLGFGSLRSQSHSHPTVRDTYSGVLQNPILLKQLVSNGRRGLLSDVVGFTRNNVPKRHFQIHRYNTSRNWSSWIPTADNVVLGLVAANVGVFALWRVLDPAFMKKNFMISVENFTSGRVHTLITSAFSHIEVEHLFSNMLGLYFFGTSIGRYFGPEFVLKLYLAGALGGSIFYLAHHAFMSSSPKGSGIWYVDPKKIPGLGASGAVNAILLLDIFLFPTATLYYNFFIPVPAILLGAFLIGKDLWRMTENNSNISGSAHLGGAFVAALAWARIRKGWI